jgi:hypothetical protein
MRPIFISLSLVLFLQTGIAQATNERASFGSSISSQNPLRIWWCPGTYKVTRDLLPPIQSGKTPSVEAAKNEYEPVQIILRPDRPISEFTARIEKLPPGITAEICVAQYLKVDVPSDEFGRKDWYPDPLVPLHTPVDLKNGENTPLWITFYISPEAHAGDQACELVLTQKQSKIATIPIGIHVFDFALPTQTHTETAYGMNVELDWHGPLDYSQKLAVWEKYALNLAKHRLSCYDPMAPAQIKVTFPSNGDQEPKIDFSDFDQMAKHRLEEMNFSSFSFPKPLIPDVYQGHAPGTPQYDRMYRAVRQKIRDHLAEKGWLEKCYNYWCDEPKTETYASVKATMDEFHRTFPNLRNILTICYDKAPMPLLYGAIDIWVVATNMIDFKTARERQKLGEKVWWYVCCVPRYPYPNNFIDHPAINHRIHFWMIEKYNLDGSLYWSTTYWKYKNPWEDPRSYNGPDKKTSWGNGDGYLLYPPSRQPSQVPVVEGPINSIRIEMIREGLEDREYFWLLRQRSGSHPHAALSLADQLIESPVRFNADPQALYAARRKLARAIMGDTAPQRP